MVAPRRVEKENVSFPVAVRRSKTPLLKLPIIFFRFMESKGFDDPKLLVEGPRNISRVFDETLMGFERHRETTLKNTVRLILSNRRGNL